MFPIVEVKGTPYECGWQHGKTVSELIQKNIEAYLRLFEFHANLDPVAAKRKAEKYISVVENFDVNFISEMQGIADGAGVSLCEIMMLNARTELLSATPLHECTSIAVLPPASTLSHTWLAQNWDWLHFTKGKTVLLKIAQVNKPEITMVIEAGQIGKMGFNDTGLGLCHNALQIDYHSIGIPFIILCRMILNSYQLSDAIQTLCVSKRAASGNYLIAHKDGFAIDVEVTPDDVDFFEPTNNILIHSNHFLSPRFRAFDHGLKSGGWDSLVRRQRAQTILELDYGSINLMSIIKVQRDLGCGTSSICVSHNEDAPELARWSTLAGIIMNLSSMEMYIAPGKPSETEYIKITR